MDYEPPVNERVYFKTMYKVCTLLLTNENLTIRRKCWEVILDSLFGRSLMERFDPWMISVRAWLVQVKVNTEVREGASVCHYDWCAVKHDTAGGSWSY